MLLPFSDTTVKNGIIQGIERWTGLGDAGISGNATLLKYFTAEVNETVDELTADIFQYLRALGFDDSNQSGIPIKKQNIVSGTGSYTFTTDDNSANIISITNVFILPSATATEYVEIPQVTTDDPFVSNDSIYSVSNTISPPLFMSPNSSQSGTPTRCMVLGLKVFFDFVPNYNATNGIKVFVNRELYQFVSTDTTKKSGLPSPFHPLLVYLTAQRYLSRNTGANAELQSLIVQGKANLRDFIAAMYPSRKKMTMRRIFYR